MGIDVHTATSAELTAMAERELGAFIAAVTELFGSEQAKIAADDWIEEFVLNGQRAIDNSRLPADRHRGLGAVCKPAARRDL